MKQFPKNFLWGASTSAFQVEGGYGERGRGIANSDMCSIPKGQADFKTASDHYHHFKEDVALMKELGLKVYRFSFLWSRIMPDGHTINEEGLSFYDQLIDDLIAQGIEPLPTLYHFEMPYHLIEEFGGWRDRRCVDAYVRYAKVCFERFGKKVKNWITINEQMCVTTPDEMNGNLEKDDDKRHQVLYQMSYHMTLAEKITIGLFHKMIADGHIGHVVAMQSVYPATSDPLDVQAAMNAQDELMWSFLDLSIKGSYSHVYSI
ncbi:glycoside hydrolase family 1 protein [Sharpea azabuensis]